MKNKLLIIFSSFLASCAAIKVDSKPPPSFKGKKVTVKNSIDIKPGFNPPVGKLEKNVWDLQGGTVQGTGRCDDKENGKRIRVFYDNLTIKNGAIVEWEDGFSIAAKGVKLENLLVSNCEECLNTTVGAENFTINKCWFRAPDKKKPNGNRKADKLLQLNVTKGNNVISNSYFDDCVNAIRVGLNAYKGEHEGTVRIENNEFTNADTAIHVVRGKMKQSGNKFKGVKTISR